MTHPIHEPINETTAIIIRNARVEGFERSRIRVETWARSPVVVLRVGLVGVYAINAYVATMALIAGVPVFNMTTPQGWSIVWAIGLLVASFAAAICASIDGPHGETPFWRGAELTSSGLVISLAATYAIALHIVGFASADTSRQVVAAVSVSLFVLPLARFAWLASQLGRKPFGKGK